MIKKIQPLLIFLFFSCQIVVGQIKSEARTSMQVRSDRYGDYKRSNLIVDSLYNTAIHILDSVKTNKSKEYRIALNKAQRSWKIYSLSHCDIIGLQSEDAPADGGESFRYQCLNNLNNKRIEELDELLTNFQIEFEVIDDK